MKFIVVKKIVPILLLAFLVLGIFYLYQASPDFLSGDDAAIHLMKVKFNYLNEGIDYIIPIAPFNDQKAYTGLILTEAPLHMIVSSLMFFLPEVEVMTLMKACLFFFAVLFAFGMYLYVQELAKQESLAIMSTFLAVFSYWLAIVYFEGTFAQLLGLVFLPAFLLLAKKFFEKWQGKYYLGLVLLTLLVFLVHPLTFMLLLTSLIVVTLFYAFQKRKKYILILFLALLSATVIAMILFPQLPWPKFFSENQLETTSSTMTDFLPKFFPTEVPFAMVMFVFGVGIWAALKKKYWSFLLLSLITFLFTQTASLGLPFFPHRFNPYFMILATVGLMIGIYYLLERITWPILRVAALATVFLIMTVSGFKSFDFVKTTYSAYYEGLSPPIITKEDFDVFVWMRDNVDKNEVIVAGNKWGLFIPSLGDHRVLIADAFDLADRKESELNSESDQLSRKAHFVLRLESSSQRKEYMEAMNLKYIFWPSEMNKFIQSYTPYENYSDNFSQSDFEVVFQSGEAKLLKVKQ
ncbi:hypothetical protein KKC60_00310 [Patescibacteria group bacterium]|nr:hypothetical protein [Patescibacteria group bacterium]